MTSKIVYDHNVPLIEIDGKRIPPVAFRSFRPRPDNISLFSRTGVRLDQMIVTGLDNSLAVKYSLFGEVWVGDGQYDFKPLDRQMKMFRRFAPDSYYNVMIPLDTRDWWLKAHPGVSESYRKLGQALVSDEWRRDAAEYLKAFIAYAEENYGDCIYAYTISAGGATEWFSDDLGAFSPEKEENYRRFCGDNTAHIPSYEEMQAGDCSLRAKNDPIYRYIDYCTNNTADLVCFFAAEAQKQLKHQKLLGMFYGYIAHSQSRNQNLWMTMGYEKAWHDSNIDMLYSPAMYGAARNFDGFVNYQVAVDSIALNGKLYLHEIDHRTHLAAYPLETGAVLESYSSEEETIQVLRRELCSALVKSAAFWWFDFFGGYYSSPGYEAELKLQNEIYAKLSHPAQKRKQLAEIAVFIDPKSYLSIKEKTDNVLSLGRNCLEEIIHCGAPVQVFNLNDITRIKCSDYKLFVFLGAVHLSDEQMDFIKKELSGKTKFFLYGAGATGENGIDFSRTAQLCGMKMEEFIAPEGENPKAAYGETNFGFKNAMCPMLAVTDVSAEMLADYPDGRHALAYCAKTKTFFSAVGQVPWLVWRDAADRAGVHLYSKDGYGLFVCSDFVAVYTVKTETPQICLPDRFTGGKDIVLHELFTGEQGKVQDGILSFRAPRGHIRLFVKAENEKS